MFPAKEHTPVRKSEINFIYPRIIIYQFIKYLFIKMLKLDTPKKAALAFGALGLAAAAGYWGYTT
jgi:NAD(P)H-flavin reductase